MSEQVVVLIYEVCALNDHISVVEWNSENKIECMADLLTGDKVASALALKQLYSIRFLIIPLWCLL